MQSGVQRALPTAAMLSALLPGLYIAQTRTAVYTSNVMDETRTKRITDHFAYMKARKQYRSALHDLFNKWRGEVVAQQAKAKEEERRKEAALAMQQAAALEERKKEKEAVALQEQLKKAELEHKLAQLQLQKAQRLEKLEMRAEIRREARKGQLLAASRRWIRHEELENAINAAMDDPQPFGFITTLPVRGGV